MGRSPCCEKVGLKKGPWTPEEDQKLIAYIEEFGHGSWRALPAKAGLQRCGKSCRLRWTNYLRPDIKRGKFSLQEEQTIIQLHALLGNRWSAIAAQLPRRTDNEIKNYWNTHLKKRLTRMGIDPTTHKPKTDALGGSGSCHSKDAANLSHMAQWESARLEAETRLVRESNKLLHLQQVQKQQPLTPARLFLNKITPLQQPSLPPCLDVLKAWQSSWSKPIIKDDTNVKKMHSMYAMMLSNDETLESPTSTLNFPGTLLPLPVPVPTTTTTTTNTTTTNNNNNNSNVVGVGLFNQNLVINDSDNEWRGEEENTMMMNNLQQQDHDDIMAAVEAFRCSGVFDNNIPPLSANNTNVLQVEALESTSTEENLAMLNGDGSICNVNLEENKHYWNSILGLVNEADLVL